MPEEPVDRVEVLAYNADAIVVQLGPASVVRTCSDMESSPSPLPVPLSRHQRDDGWTSKPGGVSSHESRLTDGRPSAPSSPATWTPTTRARCSTGDAPRPPARACPCSAGSRTIRKHRDGILAAIELGVNNARAEGLNNHVRLITRRAYGFHSAHAALAPRMLSCGPITLRLPHEPKPG